MTRLKKKAQTWHIKGGLGLAAVFVAGLFVSGAVGGVSPFGTTSNGDTGTGTSAISSGTTDTTSSSSSTLPYIVTFADGTSSADQASEIAAAGANLVSAVAPLSMDSIDISSGAEDGVLATLRANANVVDVERDTSRETDAAPNDPGYPDQWNLPMVGWDQIYDPMNPTGSSMVAVLDTGVSASTGDLTLGPGWSAFGTDPSNDPNGHGTAVASIAAATAGNGIGIAGVNFGSTTILPVQVLDQNGLGQDSDIIQGVVWAADNGANVILMSFSNPGYSQALQDAINYAWDKGAVVVAATGNDGSDSPTYPAGDAGVMGVSGTDQSDQPWASSNTGQDTFIAAPATNIPADATDGSETSVTGTSASAAMVAGAAALLMANDPNATNAIVDGRLARNADPVGIIDQTGNGRLDVAKAFADTSTDGVTPMGAPGGGPIVDPYAIAAAKTWTGTTNTDWNTGTNWSPNGVPAATDSVTIPNTTNKPTISTSVTISNPGGSLSISAGATLTIAPTGTLTMTAAAPTITGTLDVNGGTANFGTGGGQAFGVAGDLIKVENGGSFAGHDFNAGTLELDGSTSTAEVHHVAGALTLNAGTLTVDQDFTPTNSAATSSSGGTVVMGNGTNEDTKNLKPTNPWTFNNLTIAKGTNTATLLTAITVNGTFLLSSGTFSAGTIPQTYDGDFTNNATYTSGTSQATFNGSSTQQIAGTSATSFGQLTISNNVTLALSSPATTTTVQGTLNFAGGNLTTGSNTLVLPTGATVTNAGTANGFVVGNLSAFLNRVLNSSQTFQVGTGTSYTPVTLTVTGTAATTAGQVVVSSTGSDHPNINTSGLDPAHDVNRYWTIDLPSSGAFVPAAGTTYSAALNFVAGDLDSGTNTATFLANRYSPSAPAAGAWGSVITPSARTATSTTLSALAGSTLTANGSDFAIGNQSGTILDHYVISGSSSQTAGTANNLTITMKDSTGNTITGFSGTKSLTFSGASSIGSFNPTVTDSSGTARTFGTAETISFTSGVAAVSGANNGVMTLFKAESASITATDSSSITTTTPLSVTVSAATASQIVLSGGTGDLTSGQTRTFTATIEDSFGNTKVSGADSTDAISFSQSGGTGSVSFATPSSTTAGVATDVVTGVLKGTPTIGANATLNGSPTNSNTLSFNVVAGPATQVVLSGSNANLASGSQQTYTARIEDAAGNTVDNSSDSTDPISFSQTAGPGTVSFATPSATSGGVATDVVQGVLKGNVTIQANATISGHGLTNSNTLSFNVVAGPASKVVLSGSNADLASGSTKTLTATIEDAAGNTVDNSSDSTDPITFSQTGGTGSVTFATPSSTSGGVATDVVTGVLKGTFQIRAIAASSGSGGIVSNTFSFNVVAGPAAQVALSGGTGSLTSGSSRTYTATIEDAAGNAVDNSSDSTDPISFSQTGGTGSVTFATPSSTSGGVATEVVTGNLAGSVSIQANASLSGHGFTNSNTLSFSVVHGAASKLAFSVQPNSSYTADNTIHVKVAIEDAAGNVVIDGPDAGDNVSVALGGPSATLFGTLTQPASSGVASFDDLQVHKVGTGYSLHATSGTLTAKDSSMFAITPGAATHLKFDQQPITTVGNQTISPAVSVDILDQYNNLVTGDNSTQVSLAIGNNPSTGTLSGTTPQPASGGIASFGDLSIDNHGSGYTLNATSNPTLTGDTSSAFDITARSTSTSVACAPNPVDAGATTTCTATVTDTNGAGSSTPTGTVNFSSDSSGVFSSAASCTLSGGSCSVTYTPDASDDAGSQNIGAVYTGSAIHAGSTATDFSLGVTTHATLSIAKAAAPGTVHAGNNVTYTLTISNSGPSDARSVTVADPLQSPLTGAVYTVDGGPPASWGGSAGIGTITPGAHKTVVIPATVPANTDPGTHILNTATASSPTDAASPETSSQTDTLVDTQADLSITKSDGVSSVLAGGPGHSYTITVTNTGPSDARDVSVADTWPAGFIQGTVNPSQGSCDTTTSAPNFTCALGIVPAGGSATITAAYTVPPSTQGDQTNTATVSSSTTNTSSTTTASDTDHVTTEADVSITKSGPTDVNAGTPISYTLVVSNSGESDAQNVMVSDPLTPGADFVNPQYSIDGIGQGPYSGSVMFSTLAAGASHTIVITATVGSFVPDGTHLFNTATVGSDTFDQNTGNNTSATIDTKVSAVADVADMKVADSNTVISGDNVTYTLTVSNGGPSDAQNVMLNDSLDPSLSNAKYCVGTGCDPSTGTPFSSPLAYSIGTLANGGSVVVRLTAKIDPSRPPGTLSNTATVSSTTQDNNADNNTATKNVTVTTSADLSITKSGPDNAVAGQGIEYTVTVDNAGPSDAQHVTIADSLPTGLSGATYSVSGGNNSSGSYASPLDIGTIAAGGSATVTIDANIAANVPDGTVLQNFASVSSGTNDPATGNNGPVKKDTTVHAIANVSIAKTGDSTVTAGTPIHYNLHVSNPGPSDAQNVVVTDNLPDGLSNATFSVDGGGSSSWTGSTSFSTLAAGQSHDIAITADTSPSLGDGSTLKNTATVASTTTNNSGTTSSEKDTSVNTSADLSIVKSGPSTTIAGDPSGFDYTFTVTNNGPSDNTGGFTVSDTLPSSLTYVSASSTDCSASGQMVTCTSASGLPLNGVATYTIHVKLASSAEGTLTNSASVASNGTTNPDNGNDTSTKTTTITKDVHLHVVKTFQSDTVTAGGSTQTFTIAVSNTGFSDADNLHVTDGVDQRLIVTNIADGGLDCSASSTGTPATIDCSAAHLVSGDTKTITVTYKVDTTTEADPSVSNSATATSNEDSSSGTDTVAIVKDVQLDVTKQFASPTVTAGGAASSFTINATNIGASRGDNFKIVDNVPSDLLVTGVHGSVGLDCTGSNGQLVSCTEGFIASGESQSVTVDYNVSTDTDAETVQNTATASTDETSKDASDSVQVIEDVRLAITKTFDSSSVTAGGASQTFTVKVTNNGVSRADNVTINDAVDSRLQVTGFSGDFACGPATNTVHCTLPNLASGDTATLVATYKVDTTTGADPSVPNTASASADETNAPVDASDHVAIVKDVRLAVTKKFADPVVTSGGAASSFQIDVTNNGVSRADNVNLTDNVDSRLVVDSIDSGDFTCSTGSQDISCSLANLDGNGGTKSITVHYHVAPDTHAAASVGNTASATSAEVSTPATGSDTVAIVKDVQLHVTKTFADSPVTAGGAPSSFTLAVTNTGVSTADNVHLTDTVPSDLIVESIVPGGFDCGASNGQSVDCSLGTLAHGQTETVTVNFHVDTTTETETVQNTGHVSSDENTAGVDSTTASVDVIKNVQLQVTKSFADGAVDAGTNGHTFTITVKNTGVSRADNLDVTDSVDSRLIVTGVSSGDLTCAAPSQSIDCTAAHLAAGATDTITGTYRVASGTAATAMGSPVTNTAHATTDETSADSNQASVAITTRADVADLKVQTGSNIAGDNVTYTSTIQNNGPSDAQAVTFTDNLDPNLLNAQYCVTTGLTCTPTTNWPHSGSISLNTIVATQTVTVVITAQISPSTPKDYPLSNTSSANSATTTDPTPGNNSFTVSETIDTKADLSLAKSGPPSTVAGSPAGFDYTLTVTNNGPSDNTGGFTVVDTLPNGVSFDSSPDACVASSGTVTCTNSSGLAAGGAQTFHLHVLASQTLETGNVLHNSATVTSTGTQDTNSTNDTATFNTSVTKDVELAITKQFDSATVTAGGTSQTFTLQVTNNGVSQADNVEVKDSVDSRLSVDGTTGDFSCGAPSQSLDCTLAHIPAGETKSIVVTYHVAPDVLPATIDNSATVTTSDEANPITSSTASVDVVTSADLTLAKGAPASAVAGDPAGFNYKLTVTNNGPSDNTGGFTVTDTLPSGATFVGAPASDSRCSAVGQMVTCTRSSGLALNGTDSFIVHVTASQTLESTDNLDNTATVASNGTDNPANGDTATSSTPVTENVDLAISKHFADTNVIAGGAGSHFSIGVTNNGSTDAENVVVTDQVDSRLAIASIGGDFSCTQTAETGDTLLTCTLAGTLDSTATKSIQVNFHVNADTAPALSVGNTASVTADEETTPVTSSASVEIDTAADLTVSKAGPTSAEIAGNPAGFDYTLTVTNNGPSVSTGGFHVTDMLDSNLTFVPSPASSADCSASGQLVTCSTGDTLGVNGTKDFTVHVTLDPSAEETYDLQNQATVFTDSTPDPVDNDTSTTTHTQIAEDVQLALTKTFADNPVVAGGAASSFTLKVHNSGLSTADAVKITDAVPSTLQIDSIDNGSFNCGATSGQSVDCTLAHLAPSGDASITVHYHVASSALPGSVQNDASVTSEEGASDSATASVTVDRNVSLTVTKAFSPKTVIAGGAPGTFNIQVTNNGPSDASNVSLTDNVDSRLGVTNVSSSDFSCDSPSNSISCSLGTLAAGQSASVVATYSVDSTIEPAASVANHAFASSTEQPTPSEGSDSVEIDRSVNLQVTKLFQDGAVDAGTAGHTFTIDVKNNGPSQADNVQVTDNVNALLNVTNVAGGGFSCNTGQSISCSIATLGTGQDKTITVTYSVASNTAPQTVSNTANANSAEGATGTSTASVNITTHAVVSDVKDVQSAPQYIAGNTILYTSTISNGGPSDAGDVTFTDVLDSQLTNATYCVDTGSGCGASSAWPASNSVDLGPLAAGASETVKITATIKSNTPDGYRLSNTSSAKSTTLDNNSTNNTSNTVTVTVNAQADLSITKSGPNDATAGDSAGFDYTLTVHNTGPSDNTGGFSVTDNLPDGLTFQSGGTTDPRCGVSGGIVTCTNTTGLAAGGNDSFTFHVTVASNVADTTVLSNSASVAPNTGATTDQNPGNNSTASPAQTTIHAFADLTLSKNGPSSATAGDPGGFDYTFDVHNGGPSDHVGDLHVTDTLPSGVSFVSGAGCSAAGQVVTCTSTDPLPAGGDKVFTVHVTLASSATGSISNSATVASGGTAEGNTGNNSSGTVVTNINTSANLAITKDDGVSSVVAGGPGHTYTITVTNSGPSDALNVSVADSWPAGFNQGTVTSTQGSCNAATNFTCSLGTIAAGGSATITAAYTVPSSTTGDQTNTATASSSTPSNSPSASDTDHVLLQADLAITKTDGVTSATPGTNTTYTVVATNNGPSDVSGAVIADNPPAAITSDNWTATSTGTASGFAASGSGPINDTVNMPAGSTITYTITAHISAAATGNLANTATITAPAGVTDATGNNSATDTDTLTPQTDLSVTKTDGSATAVPGTSTTYSIVVSNSGQSDATGASVTDNLPAAVTSDNWTATASSGSPSGFSASGSGNINDTHVNLPVGSSVTYTLVANISPSATGTLSNTASVAAGSGSTDPSPGNNSANDTDTLTPQADLAITKTDHATSVVPGTSTTYTIIVTNNGPSAAVGASVGDPLASNPALSGDSYTSVASSGASGNTASGSGSINDTVNMAAGSTITYTVVANIKSSATGTLTNVATVTSATDNVGTDNVATDNDTLTPQADLAVSKSGPSGTVNAGNNITYNVTVKNNGPSDNTGFTLSDVLPSGLSFVSATTPDCANSSGTVTCTSSGLANGASVTWTIVAKVSSTFTGSSITNTASIATDNTPDPGNGANSGSATTTIGTSADLSITKTGPSSAQAGTPFSYTITVANAGPSVAQNVQLADTLPTSFTNASYTIDGGSTTAYSSPISLGTMDSSGASASHTIVISGTPTLATTITNQASVTSGTGDPSTTNNTSSVVSTAVSAGPAAKLSYSAQPTDTVAGATINGSTGVVVQVTDQYGNPTQTSGESIGIAIKAGSGTTGAVLTGTTPRSTNSSGQAVFNDLSIDLAGSSYVLTATDLGSGGYGSLDSNTFNITPGTLLSQVATADANWQNKIDGADVLFGKAPDGTQSVKNTNPGSFHWQLTLQNETGLQLHDPGIAINNKNGGKVEVWLTIPQLSSNVGTPIPSYAVPYENSGMSAFVTQGPNAIHVRPGPGGPGDGAPGGPGSPPDMQFTVKYIVGSTGGPTDCSQIPGSSSQWQTGEPADGTNVKCIYVSGLNIPPHGKANMDVNLQTVLAAKGNSGWASNAQNLFRAGFPFRSVTQITLDSDFGQVCKKDPKTQTTTCSDPNGFQAAYAGKQFSGAQALGLVLAGKQVTAIGGYAFDQNAFGIQGANVLLFNSQADFMAAGCNTADPRVVGWTQTQSDGFYFIDDTGPNPTTPLANDPNNLPFNIAYYVAVCNVPGVSPVNWPARYMNAGPNGAPGPKLGNKQFDEEDFFISPTTNVVFTKQPMNTRSSTAFAVSAQLQDAFGQPVPNDTSTPITLTANQNNGSMTCTPSNPNTQTGGVANFSCKISVIANNYQLTASSPGLKSSTSNFFNITK